MTSITCTVQVISCSARMPSFSHSHSRTSLSCSSINLKELQQKPIFHQVPKTVKKAAVRLLDAFVDLAFEFIGQELPPSQSNFAPVEEIEEAVEVTESVHGRIPDDFPDGVYVRNEVTFGLVAAYETNLEILKQQLKSKVVSVFDRMGAMERSNPLFGGLTSTNSIFGKSSQAWIEGEGMLHALYFSKDTNGRWKISYNNKHVQTDTFKLEKHRKKPAFLPALEGDSLAILAAYLLNWLRFGTVNKYYSNTSVFEHSGNCYSITENYIPQEIDILTLDTRRDWDIAGAWNGPFTSHPKKAPDTGELVIMGTNPIKPYFEVGVVSADGKELLHRVDLKLNRCCLCHEIGVTRRYNVILDFPLLLDINRLISGGPLLKYNKEGYARIGVMPRYGDVDSIKWFEVERSCVFHIVNCYEHDNEVVVMACRAHNSAIPGPDFGLNKFEWFSKGFRQIASSEENDKESEEGYLFAHVYEWRLNMVTGEVAEKNLTGNHYSMDFPFINEKYCGVRNKFGYTQVVDLNASSTSGMAKYGGLAKLYFEERKHQLSSEGKQRDHLIKVEYHMFRDNTFCSGAVFVAKSGSVDEDDGWIITYAHNEDTNASQVYIVDAKSFSNEPVAKIALPRRVPYGFHGAFMPLSYP